MRNSPGTPRNVTVGENPWELGCPTRPPPRRGGGGSKILCQGKHRLSRYSIPTCASRLSYSHKTASNSLLNLANISIFHFNLNNLCCVRRQSLPGSGARAGASCSSAAAAGCCLGSGSGHLDVPNLAQLKSHSFPLDTPDTCLRTKNEVGRKYFHKNIYHQQYHFSHVSPAADYHVQTP